MKHPKHIVRKIHHHTRSFIQEEYLFLLIAAVLFVILGELLGKNYLTAQTIAIAPKADPFPHFRDAAYPILKNQFVPDISAQAAYILDVSSHVVIYSKNENLRFSPASTTKLVTALTALDFFAPDDVLRVRNPNVPPVVLGLTTGEKMTFQNLLYGMLVPSGNDAAVTIAQNYPGGQAAFVKKMNEKVKLLDLQNTQFADPVGLVDDEDYTTVHDLARLFSFALSHPLLSHILDTKQIVIEDTNGKKFSLETTNKLLGLGVKAGKTGYTEEAGEVLVSSTQMNNGHTYILVVMKSDDRFGDTQKLLRLIENNVSYEQVNL